MHPGEDELIERSIRGEADALTALLERHGPPIAAGLDISSKWRSIVSPEDVMQVTYLDAFLRVCDFVPRGPGSFAAWLRRIAENNLRDAIKELERAKRPPVDKRLQSPNDRSYADLVQGLAGNGGTPSGAAAVKEAINFVEQALARLPADYETVIRLYELGGRSIREVGQAMGRSDGAVKMLLSRARDHLRDALGSRSRFFSS